MFKLRNFTILSTKWDNFKFDACYRSSLSEVGSPICERVRKKIVEYFKNNVPQRQIAKALQISSSIVHNIIKSFRETREISVRKGQGRRPLLDAHGLLALRRHCITHRHESVIDITKWAQEYFQKPLSVNTIRRAICRCQLKLYHAKRKPYVNMVQKRCCVLWAKAHLKWKSVLWSDECKFDILVGNHGSRVLQAKEEGDLPACYQRSVQKASISDGMGAHKCIRYGQVAWFGRHSECWKVYKGFRATYAPLQMTYISGKALCISEGQCKTTYWSYYNSMAS